MNSQQIPEKPQDPEPRQVEGEIRQEKKTSPWLWVLIISVAAAICAGGALILLSSRQPEPVPPPVAGDDSWEKVQTAGVLRVATAADYPPFEYYNQDYQIDGFDPALIREIGAKLGVRVDIADYAFEGLGVTLSVGQADVAIAALSVTPEREAVVDFSNIYYVGEGGILARLDAEIGPVSDPSQLAGLRVGVQKRSVYEHWAQTVLVDGNIIPSENLLAYAKPEHAINDLRQSRLDVVILDLQPAIAALSQGDLVLVGQGVGQQRLAIAVPKGANALRDQINRALLELQNEGKITELATRYLGLSPDDVIPPPTPAPTPANTPEPTLVPSPAPCVDAMEFIEDLNYDDEGLTNFPDLDPGEAFQKGWRIKNVGTCTWTSGYSIQYAHGNDPDAQMQGQPTAIQGEVAPGQTYDLYVNLVAPDRPGEQFVGYWQMYNALSTPFGQTIWVAIEVRNPAPEEPTATVPPAPTETPLPAPTETPPPPPTEKPGADLRQMPWKLVGYLANADDDALTPPNPDTEITLFFAEDDTFGGNGGCNDYNGRYVTDGTALSLTDVVISRQICEQPEGVMEQEAAYMSVLGIVEEYRINERHQLEFIRYITDDKGQRVPKVILMYDPKP